MLSRDLDWGVFFGGVFLKGQPLLEAVQREQILELALLLEIPIPLCATFLVHARDPPRGYANSRKKFELADQLQCSLELAPSHSRPK